MAETASHHPLLSNWAPTMTAALRNASHRIHFLNIGGSKLGRTVAQRCELGRKDWATSTFVEYLRWIPIRLGSFTAEAKSTNPIRYSIHHLDG